MDRPANITELLRLAANGERAAQNRLLEAVYHELRMMAAARLRTERQDHSLQPSALVNELYLRLLAGPEAHSFQNRAHFFATAGGVMRNILVDSARRRHSRKREAGQRVELDFAAGVLGEDHDQILLVDGALRELAELNAAHAQVVELKFFSGLTFDEIAVVMDVSSRTAKRYWDLAQRWLRTRLQDEAE